MNHKIDANLDLSIIIPTINEEDNIRITLDHLQQFNDPIEIIVVDGGSKDGTIDIACQYARVIQCNLGRANQMNTGAINANGDILWFLHADSIPHKKSITAIRDLMVVPEISGGAFEYNFDAKGWIYRVSEFFSNHKNQILKTIYGDMGIFVRREIFTEMAGFKNIPIMEDMEFCQRLKKYGRISILPYRLTTSARRWQREGPLKAITRNWFLQICWKFGIPPEKLAKWYETHQVSEGESGKKKYPHQLIKDQIWRL